MNKRSQYVIKCRNKKRDYFLNGKSCVRCGSNKDLEVDHIDPKSKSPRLKITPYIFNFSKEFIEEEMKKCQILCLRCHEEKTSDDLKKSHCPYGHEYNENNSSLRKRKRNGRTFQVCLICTRMRDKLRRPAKRNKVSSI